MSLKTRRSPQLPDETSPSVLLIGASRGLGAGLAGEFAKRGWTVVGTVRGEARTQLHDLADQHPGQIAIEPLDITRREQIVALRERIADRRFDMLFVNAGIANRDTNATTAEITPDEFSQVMLTNALGVMHAVEDLQDLVRPRGLIGVMSSGQGSIANNTNGRNDLYRSSKAALNQLMKSYAGRRADDQRPLVLMAPGWIRTELGGPNAPFGMEEAIPQVVDVLLAQRGRPGLRFVDRAGKAVPW
jgi:NAD(P)-dependent dehydrogenase (short-subunit alcohol dehydrogenase family)